MKKDHQAALARIAELQDLMQSEQAKAFELVLQPPENGWWVISASGSFFVIALGWDVGMPGPYSSDHSVTDAREMDRW
jgi:hypothetical protein